MNGENNVQQSASLTSVVDILSPSIQGGFDDDGDYIDDEEDNAEHCDDSQVVVIMMVMVRMMLLRRGLLIVFSTSGSKVFKLTVEILVREARGQVQASPTISSTDEPHRNPNCRRHHHHQSNEERFQSF